MSNVSADVFKKPYAKGKERKPKAVVIPEKRVKEQVRKVLKELMIWYCTPLGAGFGPAAHDFICCVPTVHGTGQLVSIETKASNGKLRPRQLATCEAIQNSNGIVMLIYPEDVPNLHGALKAIMAGEMPQKGA